MRWVDVGSLKCRFNSPLLVELDGDRRDLVSSLVELVDVVREPGLSEPFLETMYTILHVPGGTLPGCTTRAMGIVYPPAEE